MPHLSNGAFLVLLFRLSDMFRLSKCPQFVYTMCVLEKKKGFSFSLKPFTSL